MTLFRTLAYLAPLALGFGVAAALALTAGAPVRKRMTAAGSTAGAILALLLFASLGDSVRMWFSLAILLLSFGLLVAGVYLLAESARAPRELAQVVACLTVCLLMSTVFVFGPLIRAAADAGHGESTYRWITWSMDVNPFFVMGYSIFNADLLLLPAFYRMDLAGFQHGQPSWGASSAGFAVAGLALGGASEGLRRLIPR